MKFIFESMTCFHADAGLSNVEDSSSQEYLDESQYLEEDDHYTQFLVPPVPPQRLQSKTVLHGFQQQQQQVFNKFSLFFRILPDVI